MPVNVMATLRKAVPELEVEEARIDRQLAATIISSMSVKPRWVPSFVPRFPLHRII